MNTILIIAEKPDQGAKLAAPFPHHKKQGYIEIDKVDLFPNGAIITWAVGHLCELIPPEEYDPKWKKWSLQALPILPTKFQHKVTKSKWKQFNIIKGFMNRSDIKEVIIAGDAAREGEAIIRIILQMCQNKKPLKRLWISSLTAKAVIAGFANLLDESQTRSLYYEALSRACADWLVGMNASRAYTLLLQKQGISDVFSTGRVQTPTLALIARREQDINDFKSEPFWEVMATFNMDGKQYNGKWQKDDQSRLFAEEQATAIAAKCTGKPAVVSQVDKERKEYAPPLFFQLSTLQATANRVFKFSPQKTLDIAQKLYVKGLISYPRTDSCFVTAEEAAGFPEILGKLKGLAPYQPFFPLPIHSIAGSSRYVNAKKVTDHYAIIPTEQIIDPSRLASDEQKIYDLIVRRLIAAHYDKAIFNYTTIVTTVDGEAEFFSKGREQVAEGWRKVIQETQGKQGEDDELLPVLSQHEQGITEEVSVKKGETQPPKRYTEGQLITLMKTAGKHVEDKALQTILNKTEGLGTEATRAGIITTLKTRKYIEVKQNQVYPTEKGMLLIKAIGKSVLVSPEMTAKWEQRLREIGEGQASPAQFMNQAKLLAEKLINQAIEDAKTWSFTDAELSAVSAFTTRKVGKAPAHIIFGQCKKCGGNVIDKGTFYGCSNYNKTKCDFTLSKKLLGKTISQTNIKKLLKEGKTNVIKGFKKGDQTFEAILEWDEAQKKIKWGTSTVPGT